MSRQARKFDWMSRAVALFFCVVMAAAGTVFAQNEATAPPPPPDQAPTLQQAAPESQVRAVRISAVEGGVKVLQGGETAFQQAELNMPVLQGMKLVTAQDGRVEVQFEDGSVARVAPNSSITLKQLARDEDGGTVTEVEADSGLTYYELNGRAGQYTVQFGRNKIEISPVDSTIFRLDLDKAEAELAVMHGSVHMSDNENLSADVQTDQSVLFDPQNADEYQLVQSVEANSWDQWNSDRDEELAAMDTSESEARAGLDEPDNPAWSDLDANGDWYDVPGYGMGWTPSGVDADWDPYGLGAWGYYSGVGYTWISGYSWGWWPYHCGAWSWFDGFGWMWFPGNCGWGGVGIGGWYPYGTIRHMPAGYRCPRRPRWAHSPDRHRDYHGPRHGPVLRNPKLIAVNRGERFTRQFKVLGKGSAGSHTTVRVLDYGGQSISPVVARVHPVRGGPLGEGFSNTVRRTNPGLTNSLRMGGAYAGSMYRPSVGVYRTEGQPITRPVYRANPGLRMPDRSTAQGGVRAPSAIRPPMHAPTPVFRAPERSPERAPTPVYRGPSPAFHPAPTPAFHAPPTPAFHAPPPAVFHGPAAAPAGHGRH